MCLICNYRPNYHPPFTSSSNYLPKTEPCHLNILFILFLFLPVAGPILWFLFNRPFKYFVSTVCIFSFFATSQPKVYIEPNWDFDKDYGLPFSKKELLTNRMSYGFGQDVDSTVLKFEKIILRSFTGTYDFTTTANLKEIDSTSCVLTLTKLTNYTVVGVSKKKKAELSKDEFLKEFDLVIKNIIDNPTPNGVEYSAYNN